MSDKITIDVVAGLCQLEFRPGCSTGKDDDTNPGVGFILTSKVPAFQSASGYHHGSGVIRRSDAARLRDALEIFLKATARGEDH